METASSRFAPVFAWTRRAFLILLVAGSNSAIAAGTAVGTLIENTALVNYEVSGASLSRSSNTTTITVAERINVTVTLQSPQLPVTPGDTDQALLFTVTNTGNGTETFALSMESVLGGDDFDPQPSATSIYFDTDASGDLNAGDEAYVPGTNDPDLTADESISVFIVNDIPLTATNGQTGLSELTATSATGTGAAGTVFAGQGDGGVNAVIGTTGGEAADTGEYLVSDVQIDVAKAQVVLDPFGGAEPIPAATITYTITVEVTSGGTAEASVVQDAIPTWTTFVPGSITLNGGALTDVADADAGEFDTSGSPTVVVTLGDLVQGDGVQTIVFQVTID